MDIYRTAPERREALIKAARNALQCQDACNGCGVAQSFARDFSAVLQACAGTDDANRHPVVVLYLSKLCDLARIEGPSLEAYSRASKGCEALIAESEWKDAT